MSGARNFVWLDPWTGAVVERRTHASMSRGDRFILAQYSLRTGGYLGWPGRTALFASGIALAALAVIGVFCAAGVGGATEPGTAAGRRGERRRRRRRRVTSRA